MFAKMAYIIFENRHTNNFNIWVYPRPSKKGLNTSRFLLFRSHLPLDLRSSNRLWLKDRSFPSVQIVISYLSMGFFFPNYRNRPKRPFYCPLILHFKPMGSFYRTDGRIDGKKKPIRLLQLMVPFMAKALFCMFLRKCNVKSLCKLSKSWREIFSQRLGCKWF